MRLLAIRLAAAVAACSIALPAAGAEPALRAVPRVGGSGLKAGITRITPGALAYRPDSSSAPAPLIVLMHPAGGRARDFLGDFIRIADRRGAVLLALDSAGTTWILKPDGHGSADFGSEPEALDGALAALFAQVTIDPRRIAILGFSDGASYGLSIALANPRLFSGAVALSPGTVWLPPRTDSSQRIFIAHGRRDDVLPFRGTRDRIVPGLENAGLSPRTYWFDGGHEIDPRSIEQGIDHVIGTRPTRTR